MESDPRFRCCNCTFVTMDPTLAREHSFKQPPPHYVVQTATICDQLACSKEKCLHDREENSESTKVQERL